MTEVHNHRHCSYGWGDSTTVIHVCDKEPHKPTRNGYKHHLCLCGDVKRVKP